jgi:hypothetical protein
MFLSVCATVTLLALPASANRIELQPDQPQEPCNLENRTALYKAFLADYKGDTAKAYEAAKKYVACPVDQTDEAEVGRVKYLKNWIAKYEKATVLPACRNSFWIRNMPKPFRSARIFSTMNQKHRIDPI